MDQVGFEARLLLREARAGVLATVAGGEPAQGLVTPATDVALRLILLLSSLSAHTEALEADTRCALLVTGVPAGANPQLTPRVSVNGRAEKLSRDHPDFGMVRARYLAVHPYASLYVDFADFAFWRIRSEAALHVAGFGRARRLSGASLCPTPEAAASIERDAGALMDEARRHVPTIVGLDGDGIDVADADHTVRRSFGRPASDRAGWMTALEALAG